MTVSDPETTVITGAMLEGNKLFQGLSPETLELLAAEVPCETAMPGEMLMRENEVDSHMFLVLNGEMEVLHKGGGDRDVRVALLGPGDWVGEMAILDVQPRSASVRSLAPSQILRIRASDVRRLLYERDMTQYALLVMNIARELSRRLRVADRVIANASTQVAATYVQESRRPPPR